MNTNKEETKILNIQLAATFFFIISLVISFLLTYNEKLKFTDKNFFNENDENKLALFNRILVVVLSATFLYAAYQNRKIAKKKQEPLDSYSLQIFASELSTLAAVIALYIIITSYGENYTIIANIENPTL